jgi:hypothetical protein
MKNFLNRVSASVAILLIAAVSALSAPPAVEKAAKDSTAMVKSILSSTTYGRGSAAYIGNDFFVTNHHVVEGTKGLTVTVPGTDVSHKCIVVAVDDYSDIAIIKSITKVTGLKPVVFAVIGPVRGPVYAAGYGSSMHDDLPGEFLRVYGGGKPDYELSHRGWYRFAGDEGCSIAGDSGGPAFDQFGRYIGPIWGTDDTNTYAVRSKELLKLIAKTYIGE